MILDNDPNAILLNICPQLLGQETNTGSENIPWKWFVDHWFFVGTIDIILNNKKLKAESMDMKVSSTVLWSLHILSHLIMTSVVRPVVGPCDLWLTFIGIDAW